LLVSIIIPAFNSEKYIGETIQSALDQTWKNIEIIIVDDGSTDGTVNVIKQFESANNNIKLVVQQNRGACNARNTGFVLSKGSYIQFLDSDDVMDDSKIEKQLHILQHNPNSIIGCRWIKFQDSLDNTVGGMGPHTSIQKNMSATDWLLERMMMPCHAWLTPRILIEQAGGWNESLTCNQDGDFFFRIISKSESVLYQDDTIVYYRTDSKHTGVSVLSSYDKYVSLYKVALTYKEIMNKLTDHSAKGKIAIGNYLRHLEYNIFYPNYPDLILACKKHDEYAFANNKPELTGITKKLSLFLGWRLAKKLSYKYRSVIQR
jgi:glycosyltransferase involved in cell wall biosynthesis